MTEGEGSGLPDRLVRWLAEAMNSLGLNGSRLLWRWNHREARRAETGMQRDILLRSARGRHKMCPSCRALVSRSSGTCSECGESLAGASTPGVGRLVQNLLPGITATTSLIMLVNGFWFAMMILAQIKAGDGGGGIFGGFGGELMVRFGSGLSREVPLPTGGTAGGEWWRLITPIFLHAGLLHFFFNSYLLVNLGRIVEEIYGAYRYWVIYLLCGISGSMLSQFPRFVNTIGASGAIMGLIGLLLVHGVRGRTMLGQNMKSFLMRLIVYMVIMSFFFNIDHLAHIGGFACGALLALILPRERFRSRAETLFWQVLSFAGVLLVLYAFYQVAAQGKLSGGI